MTFEVPAAKQSVGQDRFEFTIDGETYSVKKVKFLSVGSRQEIAEDTGSLLDFFGAKGTKQGDAVRGLDEDQFGALTEAWQKDSGVSVGESEASSS